PPRGRAAGGRRGARRPPAARLPHAHGRRGRRGRARGAVSTCMSEPAPEEVIWDCLRGGLRTRALAIVADLGIAQRLAGGPRPVDELARETGSDADALHRLLRALASDGVFAEGERRVFCNTRASEVLLADGWNDFAHLF